jgi:hypothetical protein
MRQWMKGLAATVLALVATCALLGCNASGRSAQPLTVHIMGFTPHLGQLFQLRVWDTGSGRETARVTVNPIMTPDFDVVVPNALFHGHSYYVDFYADLNRNLRYDSPPTDHAWRIAMPAVAEGPLSISFMHDTNWTDINFPDSGP